MRIHLAVRKIPGIVLLSHSQIYSTIAAGALNYRVREGNVCFCSAMDTGKYIQFKKSLVEVRLKIHLFCETAYLFLPARISGLEEKRWLSLTAD